jgi:hypothetical protein
VRKSYKYVYEKISCLVGLAGTRSDQKNTFDIYFYQIHTLTKNSVAMYEALKTLAGLDKLCKNCMYHIFVF